MAELLMELFGDAGDIARFVSSLHGGEKVAHVLPSDRVSRSDMAYTAVDHLKKCGMITKGLFDELVRIRPHRMLEIQRTAVSWASNLAQHGETARVAALFGSSPPDLDSQLMELGLLVAGRERAWEPRRVILRKLVQDEPDLAYVVDLLRRFVVTTTNGADLFWARESLWTIANMATFQASQFDVRRLALEAASEVLDHIPGRAEATQALRGAMLPIRAPAPSSATRKGEFSDFSISRTPITNEFYALFDRSHCYRGTHKDIGELDELLTAPVVDVSWYEAVMFAEWVGAALPTEAEWEYACRAGSSSRYCFGDDEKELEHFAWYARNSRRTVHLVQQKRPNAWGLFDMHGNVWEWCENPSDPVHACEADELRQPFSRTSDTRRSIRGGSWCCVPHRLCSSHREDAYPSARSQDVGFRIVIRSSSPPTTTLLSNSRSKGPHAALMEWQLRQFGFARGAMSCGACGKRILNYARLENLIHRTVLVYGRDCYKRLLRESWARETNNPAMSEARIREDAEKRIVDETMKRIRSASDWRLADIDYGSWKKWFVEQAVRGLLPEELSEGLRELRSGCLISDEHVERFVAYHNANRRFPGHILLPHARIRALFHQPSAVPISLTIDEAAQFAARDKPRAELGSYVVERIKALYECENCSHAYAVVLVYNYILSLARGYEGTRGSLFAAWRFLCNEPLLRRNPAFDGLTPEAVNRASLDVEVRNTLHLLAQTVVGSLAGQDSGDAYVSSLIERIGHIAQTGRVSAIWPLASSPSPNPSPAYDADAAASVRSMFEHHGVLVEGEDALTQEARAAWQELHEAVGTDIVILAGWADEPDHRSQVAVLMTRQRSLVAVGLNRAWGRASTSIRRTALNVIFRDLLSIRQEESQLTSMRIFLISVTPASTAGAAPASGSLLKDLRIHLESSETHVTPREGTAPPPRLVADVFFRTLRYDRWSHALFVPTDLLSREHANRRDRLLGRCLEEISSLEPILEAAARGDVTSGTWESWRPLTPDDCDWRPDQIPPHRGDENSWYGTGWAWVQPEENSLEYFVRRFCFPHEARNERPVFYVESIDAIFVRDRTGRIRSVSEPLLDT